MLMHCCICFHVIVTNAIVRKVVFWKKNKEGGMLIPNSRGDKEKLKSSKQNDYITGNTDKRMRYIFLLV